MRQPARRRLQDLVFSIGAILASAAATSGAVLHDEDIDGDLSGDGLSPNRFALALGSNELLATSIRNDREYVRLTVPTGTILSSVVLTRYIGLDLIGFIGVQRGETFTEPSSGTNVANLLGWAHYGPVFGDLPRDYLSDIGMGPGAIGFTGALGANDYTFWIQQTGSVAVTYTFDFVVTIPAPGSIAGLAGLLALSARRRRQVS